MLEGNYVADYVAESGDYDADSGDYVAEWREQVMLKSENMCRVGTMLQNLVGVGM